MYTLGNWKQCNNIKIIKALTTVPLHVERHFLHVMFRDMSPHKDNTMVIRNWLKYLEYIKISGI